MIIRTQDGLTRIELIAIIIYSLILVLLILPTLQRGPPRRYIAIRCMVNMKKIFNSMHEYANDYNDFIVPCKDKAGKTWVTTLQSYISDSRSNSTGYGVRNYIDFFCLTRYAMDQKGNDIFKTNYAANINLMGYSADTQADSSGDFERTNLQKFKDYDNADNIALLFEASGWIIASPEQLTDKENSKIGFVHNEMTHVLFVTGTTRAYQSNFPLDMRLK